MTIKWQKCHLVISPKSKKCTLYLKKFNKFRVGYWWFPTINVMGVSVDLWVGEMQTYKLKRKLNN